MCQGRSILSHDCVFWCGDFNYRIDLPNDEVKNLVESHNWTALQEYDQLNVQRAAEKVCFGYRQGVNLCRAVCVLTRKRGRQESGFIYQSDNTSCTPVRCISSSLIGQCMKNYRSTVLLCTRFNVVANLQASTGTLQHLILFLFFILCVCIFLEQILISHKMLIVINTKHACGRILDFSLRWDMNTGTDTWLKTVTTACLWIWQGTVFIPPATRWYRVCGQIGSAWHDERNYALQ